MLLRSIMLQIRLLNEDLQRKAKAVPYTRRFLMLDEYGSKQNRIYMLFHNAFHTLCQYVPLKYLLKPYKDENGSIAKIIDEWDKKMDKYRGYFNKSTQGGTDEKLLIGKMED
ncbi:hypothetical protein GQX74_012416 [Glossina fuscipes]|nr:hypothetical protein GQX74_012416 [Glossina fuscipes]